MRKPEFGKVQRWRLVALTTALLTLFSSALPRQFLVARAATVTIDLSTAKAFDLSIIGAQPDDMAGTAVAVGDLNGDGIDDLVIGIPGSDGPDGQRLDSGEVRIFFGKPGLGGNFDLASGGGDVRLFGADVRDFFGSNLAFIDVNLDGIKDLIISAPGGDGINNSRESAGELYVLFGGKPIATTTIDFAKAKPDLLIVGPRAGSRIGSSLAGGDLNGDGREDLLIGAPGTAFNVSGPQTGAVFGVISVNLAPPAVIDLNNNDRIAITILGAADGDKFGTNIAVGDFNRDGQPDIVVTAPGSRGSGGSMMAGSMNIFYGPFSMGTLLDLSKSPAAAGFTLLGPSTGSRLGEGLAVGDIDADRIDDIVVTAPGATGAGRPNSGQTFVLYGSTPLLGMRDLASMSADASFSGVNPGDQLGSSIVVNPVDQIGSGPPLLIADIDKDNFKDVIIGAPNATSPADRARNGEAFVLLKGGTRFEQRDLQLKPADITILGPRSLDQVGSKFALGDINGDGKPDLVIAAPLSNGPQGNRSRAGMIFSVSNFNPNAPGNNQPPTISEIGNQTVGEGGTINVDVSALDPDDSVALSLVRPPTPSFVTLQDFGNGKGRITIAPPSGSIGTYTVTVKATDNGNPPLSVTRDFSVTVTPPAPSISSVAFDGKKSLTIVGSRFGSAPRVLINNVDQTKRIKTVSDTVLTLKGKATKLGLRSGDNSVQVIDASGAASNLFILKL